MTSETQVVLEDAEGWQKMQFGGRAADTLTWATSHARLEATIKDRHTRRDARGSKSKENCWVQVSQIRRWSGARDAQVRKEDVEANLPPATKEAGPLNKRPIPGWQTTTSETPLHGEGHRM